MVLLCEGSLFFVFLVFSAPTGIDADMDKSMLPAVMQVRSKWGLRGRTKYTHLADQDTTLRDNHGGYGRISDELQRKIDQKRGGMKPLPGAPSEKRSKH